MTTLSLLRALTEGENGSHPKFRKVFIIFLRLILALRQECDEICTLGVLLQTSEHHLRTNDVLLRVDQELVEVLLAPIHTGALHRVTVRTELASTWEILFFLPFFARIGRSDLTKKTRKGRAV